MQYVTCDHCGGSGEMRRGEMVPGIDWSFDFSVGFRNMCSPQAVKDEWRDRCVAFLRTLKSGDQFLSSGQFTHTAVEVGMYDGWPYWQPTPAVSYVGPLGSIEYDFYNNISAPWPRREAGHVTDAIANAATE